MREAQAAEFWPLPLVLEKPWIPRADQVRNLSFSQFWQGMIPGHEMITSHSCPHTRSMRENKVLDIP
jgi:hypothetical protein